MSKDNVLSTALKWYGHFAAHHPGIILVVVGLLTLGAFHGASLVQTAGISFSKMLPEDLPVIKTQYLVEDSFAGAASISDIVVQVDPNYEGADGIVDVRDPMVVEYADILTKKTRKVENILDATSVADVLRTMNNGRLPSSKRSISSDVQKSALAQTYISPDYSVSIIRVSVGDVEGKQEALMRDLQEVISSTAAPPGITAGITGEPAMAVTFKELTGPDMERTSRYTIIGILVVSIILFTSIRYGVLPIITVMVGTFWSLGLMGVLGIKISSAMAGFTSMVMAIGIEFSIQVVNRYRQEKDGIFGTEKGRMTPEEAVATTLPSVMGPMGTTTLAALVGFRAMSMGSLQFLADLGNVMALGVFASFIASITLIPALLIITEKRKRGD